MKKTLTPFIPPILYAALGVLAFITADTALLTIFKLLGGALAVLGTYLAVKYLMKSPAENFASNSFVTGFVMMLLGITMIMKAATLVPFVPYVMGLLVAVNGIRQMQNAIDAWKLKLDKPWAVALVAVVNLAFGIIVMLNPWASIAAMMKAVGIGLVISAVVDLVTTFVVLGKSKG